MFHPRQDSGHAERRGPSDYLDLIAPLEGSGPGVDGQGSPLANIFESSCSDDFFSKPEPAPVPPAPEPRRPAEMPPHPAAAAARPPRHEPPQEPHPANEHGVYQHPGSRVSRVQADAPRPAQSSRLDSLDLDSLLRRAVAALEAQHYRMAVALLQEASQRAPLRSDIRQTLREAMDMQARFTSPAAIQQETEAPMENYRERVLQEVATAERQTGGRKNSGEGLAQYLPMNTVKQLAVFRRPPFPVVRWSVAAAIVLTAAFWGWPILSPMLQAAVDLRSPEERQAQEIIDRARIAVPNDPEEALDALAEADNLKLPEGMREELSSLTAQAHSKIGNEFFGDADYDQAIRHFEQAVRHQPTTASYHYDLGMAKFHAATRDFNLARGSSALDKNRLREALAAVEESIKLEPDHAQRLNTAAEICVKLGQSPRARQYWQQIIEVVDDSDDPYYRRAERSLRSHGVTL